jgi:hypothetical protein
MLLDVKNPDSLRCSSKLSFAGAICELTTNSRILGEILSDSTDVLVEDSKPVFTMEIIVEEDQEILAGAPHFRGMHHLVIATFGVANVFVFDLLRRHVRARITHSIANDRRFWQQKMLPIMTGVMGSSIGVLPMHAACLASEGSGLLIAGKSGAGKSTLSAALAINGFDFISDDWTYLSRRQGRLSAYGTSAPMKLLPDAHRHFELLSSEPLARSMSGELAYGVDARVVFGATVARRCDPRWLIFLERFSGRGSEFVRLRKLDAQAYLESSVERLPAQLIEARAARANIIDVVSRLPSWTFRYGGSPQYAALELRAFVETRRQESVA